MLRPIHCYWRAALLLVFLFAGVGLAQGPMGDTGPRADDRDEFRVKDEAATKRKGPRFMRRPKKDNPTAQLAYADRLAAENKLIRAGRHYDALVRKWAASSEAGPAQRRLAEVLTQRRKYVPAFDEYQYLADHFVGELSYTNTLVIQYRLAETIMRQRHLTLGFLPGFAAPEKAIPLFEKIVASAPNWERSPQAQFNVGWINEQIEDRDLAIVAYETGMLHYPDSPLAPLMAFRRAQLLYELAKDAPRDEESCREALSAGAGFVRDHPRDSEGETVRGYMKELQEQLENLYYDRAVYYDRTAKRPKSAMLAYEDFVRRFPKSERAEAARERISELEVTVEAQETKP